VGAVGHYLEEEGVPTTQISLVREHTQIIAPPRALWVPFMLGRPLGAPHDAAFQRKVLLAALRLFEAPSGPVLSDFPEAAPASAAPRDEEGEACPVNFSRPRVAGAGEHALAQALADEIAQLQPWHDLATRRRGGTTVGVSGRTPAEAGAFVVSHLGAARPDPIQVQALKYACDDLRAFYEEAGGAQPGALSGPELERWLYLGTVYGEVLQALRPLCAQSADPALQRFGKLLLIPRAIAAEIERKESQKDGRA
jgi:hypothetical protein